MTADPLPFWGPRVVPGDPKSDARNPKVTPLPAVKEEGRHVDS